MRVVLVGAVQYGVRVRAVLGLISILRSVRGTGRGGGTVQPTAYFQTFLTSRSVTNAFVGM